MYQCLVADDNIIERDVLLMHLSNMPEIEIVGQCANGLEVIGYLQKHHIDIVISDIDMPELSGINLLRLIKHPPVFIFISSYPEYAAESYDLDVIDYIVKPATFERVLKAVEKATEYIEIKKDTKQYSEKITAEQVAQEIGGQISTESFFFIKENNNYTKLNIADITHIESMGDFSRIHTVGQKTYVVLVSLKNIEKQLSPNIFRRIHRQYIANLLHISVLNGTEVHLTDKTTIPLSNAYRQTIIETVVDKKLLKRFSE